MIFKKGFILKLVHRCHVHCISVLSFSSFSFQFLINREGQVVKRYRSLDDPSVCTKILLCFRYYIVSFHVLSLWESCQIKHFAQMRILLLNNQKDNPERGHPFGFNMELTFHINRHYLLQLSLHILCVLLCLSRCKYTFTRT